MWTLGTEFYPKTLCKTHLSKKTITYCYLRLFFRGQSTLPWTYITGVKFRKKGIVWKFLTLRLMRWESQDPIYTCLLLFVTGNVHVQRGDSNSYLTIYWSSKLALDRSATRPPHICPRTNKRVLQRLQTFLRHTKFIQFGYKIPKLCFFSFFFSRLFFINIYFLC